MKKFVSMIAVSTAILIFGVNLAQAQTADTQLTAPKLLPETVNIYYEFDTGSKNPLENFLTEEIKTDFISSFESAEIGNALLALLENNTISVAMNFNSSADPYTSEPEMYISFEVTTEDLEMILELADKPITETDYNGYTIYSDESEPFYIVHFDNFLIAAPSLELAQALIDNNENKNAVLADVEGFQATLKNRLDSDFFFIYMDPSTYNDLITTDEMIAEMPFMSFYNNILEAVYAEGISVAQTDTGFDFSVYVEGTYEKLKELNLLMDKYNFVPGLYKELSGKGIILYSEQYNLAQSVKDTLMMFSEAPEVATAYGEFQTAFTETTGYYFETDVLPIFTGNYLFAVHNDEAQIFPAVTMIFESSADRTKTINMLANMSNTMKMEFEATEKESGMEYYSYQIARAGGASFYQHRFDLTALMGEYSVGKDQVFVINYTLDGNKLVISTHSDFDTIYGKDGGITYNETFDTAFTNRTDTISSIAFFDFTGLQNYLAGVMSKTGASEEEITFMNDLLAPWHSFFGISYATANTTTAYGSLKVDVEGFAAYEELFTNYFSFDEDYDYDYEYPDFLPIFDAIEYCDVTVGDWYFPYINDLTSTGIVSGYENGCFGPHNQVTRAEFTKMVLGAAEWNGLYGPAAMSDQDIYFNDVPSDAWYWHYVNQAATHGYIKGYSDDTFRPASPISRSEAVQILYNVSPTLQAQTGTEPFNDVALTDWYYTAVNAAYNAGVINGTSFETFDPNRNLTRAEAAKIVSNYMYLY